MNYFELANNTEDVLEKIQKAELEERFNDHLDPISSDGILPVDENFPYIPGFFLSIKWWFRRNIFLRCFTTKLNRKFLHTTVSGRENLKKIKSAVFVCNHINKFDGLIYDYAVNFKKTKIMVAEFNNRPGFLGSTMRADGIMPFKPTKECIKKFNSAIEYYLKHNTGILFFPEGSEWWCYKKPRPMSVGAFHYAASAKVPVIPMYISFNADKAKLNEGDVVINDKVLCIKTKDGKLVPGDVHVEICEPIYYEEDKTKAENTKLLMKKSEEAWQKCYEKAYGEKLN